MKIFKKLGFLALVCLISISIISCGNTIKGGGGGGSNGPSEKIELTKAMLSEVEFENAKTVSIEQDSSVFTISGTIDAMSESQKTTFGVDEVTHVFVIKLTFDRERTLSYFELKGNTTKVYSTNSDDENYVGPLTDLLDNEEGEDAYTILILSANTKEYSLTVKYTDDTESRIQVKVVAALATATEE